MRVLITGGYGFLGSHICRRLCENGDEVIIVDDMSSNACAVLKSDYYYYRMNAADAACADVFTKHKIDAAVHLAWKPVTGNDNGAFTENIGALNNILYLCGRYRVPKLIFISSAEIYGSAAHMPDENASLCPETPEQMCFSLCEKALEQWRTFGEMETVALRTATVYGSGQNSRHPLSGLFRGMPAPPENGNKLWSLVYADDLAAAVLRALAPGFSGDFNIVPSDAVMEDTLYRMTQSFIKGEKRLQDIAPEKKAPAYDGTKAAQNLKWRPETDLVQGIEATCRWFKTKKKLHGRAGKNDKTGTATPVMLPLLANMGLFLIAFGLSGLQPDTGIFARLDFYLLYILTAGVLWGCRQSVLSIVLSCAAYLAAVLAGGTGYAAVLAGGAAVMAQYVLVGVVTGCISDYRNRRLRRTRDELTAQQRDAACLSDLFYESMHGRDQKKIQQEPDGIDRIYRAAVSLDTLDKDRVLYNAFEAIGSAMDTREVCIYRVGRQGQHLRRAGYFGAGKPVLPASVAVSDYPIIEEMQASQKVWINTARDAKLPAMMAPVIEGDAVTAIVTIDTLPLEKINEYNAGLLKVCVNFVSRAIARTDEYEKTASNSRYMAGTSVLKHSAFMKALEVQKHAKADGISDFVLLKVNCNGDQKEKAEKLAPLIREEDLLGEGQMGELYVLLANAGKGDAQTVIQRITDAGL